SIFLFFFHFSASPPSLPSFPTRRSSDLLLLILIIDTFWDKKTTGRAWRVVLMLTFVGLICMASVFAPDMFEDRISGQNVYGRMRSEEHTSELQSPDHLVCRLLLEKKKKT